MWKRENRLGKEEYRVEKGTGFGKKGTNRHFTSAVAVSDRTGLKSSVWRFGLEKNEPAQTVR